MTGIPSASPLAAYLALRGEIDAAVASVLAAGHYVLGPEVAAFEAELGARLGLGAGVGVASGTDAIRIALGAAGVGPGDEVITGAHTAPAVIQAIGLAGATAVLVDVDPLYLTLAPELAEAAIGPRTRAVVAVHLYGQPADLNGLSALCEARDLHLIEDCAQAAGARLADRPLGTIGDLAAFSFYPTKNIGALGDGGLIATNDGDLAERCRIARGASRLDELQAAVLRVKLPHLDAGNAARAALAARYDAALRETPLVLPEVRPGALHAWHLYVVRSDRRDQLRRHLEACGVQTGLHYPLPAHHLPELKRHVRTAGPLPVAERAAREVLSLPLFPELAPADADRVIEAVRRFFA